MIPKPSWLVDVATKVWHGLGNRIDASTTPLKNHNKIVLNRFGLQLHLFRAPPLIKTERDEQQRCNQPKNGRTFTKNAEVSRSAGREQEGANGKQSSMPRSRCRGGETGLIVRPGARGVFCWFLCPFHHSYVPLMGGTQALGGIVCGEGARDGGSS